MIAKDSGMASHPLISSPTGGSGNAPTRQGAKYIGPACCGKVRLAVFQRVVVTACPDHPPQIIVDGKLQPLEPPVA